MDTIYATNMKKDAATRRKEDIREIWTESFDDSPEWIEMFFSQVYRDQDALTLSCDGRMVCSMMLQPYAMTFHGEIVPTSYICGAATIPAYRSKGYMTELMWDALLTSYRRGDMFCTLIPANAPLFHFYEHFGFSPAFYRNVERYTSAHVFSPQKAYTQIADTSTDMAYEVFNGLMMQRPCCMQHTYQQWCQILMDNSVDGGSATVLMDEDGKGAAVILAVPTDDETVKVTELLARDADARLAALAAVREIYGEMQIEVMGYLDAPQGRETAYGSIRIVNAYRMLQTLADSYPEMKLSLRVRDSLLPQNSHIYIIDRGNVVINDGFGGKLDYDVDIEVLTSIIFGNNETRRLLDFPATRPFMSLMLD